jgi:methionyl-tRNA formyltransferase
MNNFIFFGSPLFSKIVLEKIIENGFVPKALVCNPDKPTGRKKIITPPETKKLILEKYLNKKIKILQPEKLNQEFINEILKINPSFAIVCAYSKILNKEVLNLFPKGILGVHPSILPKYRGPAPIQWTILNGEKESGVTIYLLDELTDHGPILAQQKTEILNLNFEQTQEKLANLAGELLVKTIPLFLDGKINPQIQDETLATYTKKFKTEDAYIDFNDILSAQNFGGEKAIEIYKKIKALNPEPGVWTIQNNKRIKILDAEIILNKIKITKIQKEGEKPKNLKENLLI